MFDMDTANVDDPELVEVDKKIKSKVSIVVKNLFLWHPKAQLRNFLKIKTLCITVLLISS